MLSSSFPFFFFTSFKSQHWFCLNLSLDIKYFISYVVFRRDQGRKILKKKKKKKAGGKKCRLNIKFDVFYYFLTGVWLGIISWLSNARKVWCPWRKSRACTHPGQTRMPRLRPNLAFEIPSITLPYSHSLGNRSFQIRQIDIFLH